MRSSTGMVFLIMMGGPITRATAFRAGTWERSKTCGHETDLAGPVRRLAARIDAAHHTHAGVRGPFVQFRRRRPGRPPCGRHRRR